MNRLMLLTSTALVALCASLPAFADSTSITQNFETNGYASQHQAGGTGDTATILQQSGSNDKAVQEQARFYDGGDFATGGNESITQTSNATATATQEDNSYYGTQSINQTSNFETGAAQVVNDEGGAFNSQSITQTSNQYSTVNQVNGINATAGSSGWYNSQTANQTGQYGSTISQTIDGSSYSNTQNATQNSPGTGNSISTLIESGSNNVVNQGQDVYSSYDTQTANINYSSGNNVLQYQGPGSSNTQTITMGDYTGTSNSGIALQWQASGVTGGSQTITQDGNGTGNQAGQGQGSSGNTETIAQMGGSGNVAIQNQGLNYYNQGFMYFNGSQVTHF
jgi:hypothetical protein